MDDGTRQALDAIRRARAELERLRGQPIVLSDEYLAHIKQVEALPQNQSGAEKTWLEAAREGFRRHFAASRRI